MDHQSIVKRMPDGGVTHLPTSLLPFIWFFVRQIKLRFSMMVLLGIVAGTLSALAPYFFGQLVEVIAHATDKKTIWHDLNHLLIPAILALVAVPSLYNLQGWLNSVTMPYFANMVRRQLSLYMHDHSFRFFQDDYAGRLSGKVIEMPVAIRLIVNDVTGPFIYALVTFAVSMIVFSSIGWTFTAFTAIYLVLYGINTCFFIPRIQSLSNIVSEKRSIVRGRYVDILTNIFLVKIFARKHYEDESFIHRIIASGAATSQEELTITRMFRVQHVINSSFMASLIFAVVHGWQNDTLTVAQITMVLPMAFSMLNATFWLTEVYTQFFQRLGEVREGMDAVVASHEVIDASQASVLTVQRPSIEWKNVTFSYPSRPMFTDFSLTIPAKQRIGLVGPSGAGKSTFVQLLLRLHDVQCGEILIDGQNIARVSQESLRNNIAMIPQNADLLHRTIRENISYGSLDATEDQIIEAAKQAEAHEFILNLTDKNGATGYDAIVGERGVKLSGGQRQRIAIARAILKNAPILVLDEATASLDSESEKLIQKSLETVMKDRTVIVIAHRLSTIAHLDRLIVMQEGKIIEDGTHKELLDQQGLYARLWSLQSGGFL